MAPLLPEAKKREGLRQNSWESLFSKDHLSDAGQLRFLSRMSYIAVAHYLLFRGVLPLGVFKRRKLEDIAIYCFDGNKRWGQKLSEMLKGIKEAIDLKYVKQAFIMINEDRENPDVATEVFSIDFCYSEQHAMAVLDDKGNCIMSFDYMGEKAFRLQVKHAIKKLSIVTKKLKPLKEGVMPFLKLTYYDYTPDDYEPSSFKRCQGTYVFKPRPTFYKYSHITNHSTAAVFSLKSLYIDENDVANLDDLMLADYEHNDDIRAMDVTADGFFTSDEQSPGFAKPPQKQQSLATVESDRSSGGQLTTIVSSPVGATTHSTDATEKARYLDTEETALSAPQFESPENVILDADESEDADDSMFHGMKKIRESPYVKARPKRSRLNTPRKEISRWASKRVTKSSVSSRSVLLSPNDGGGYSNSPIA